MRAAATIVAAVLLLVGGAVAASYAALNDSSQQQAAAPPPPSAAPQVAQAPPAANPAAPAPPAAPTPPPATHAPAPVPPPASKAIKPPAATPAPTPAPTKTHPTQTQTAPAAKPTPASTAGLQELSMGPDAASVYDPYKRATDQTDPADAYDADPTTAFTINTAAGQSEMAVGLDFDLEQARTVRAAEIHTTTPGFRVEVYGAEKGLPPDILDNRWTHLRDKSDVAAKKSDDGTVTVKFDPGKYRHVLLWFTTPPPAGPAIAISEVRLLD
jgi:hypothetical protein